uniref:Uncharacterized protein n=1 Tax=Panagrolaimus sp. JU765 TaxID=591449 RepID=A0AC34QN59_9BILA
MISFSVFFSNNGWRNLCRLLRNYFVRSSSSSWSLPQMWMRCSPGHLHFVDHSRLFARFDLCRLHHRPILNHEFFQVHSLYFSKMCIL